MATAQVSTTPYAPTLLLTPSPSPPSALDRRTSVNRFEHNKPPLFDLHSSSASSTEWTAAEMTLLRARLEKAGQQRVLLKPGHRARLLTPEERERLRRDMEEDQLSEGSSAVGSWQTDEESVAAPKPNGIAAVLAAAAQRDAARAQGRKMANGKGQPQHIEHARQIGPFFVDPLGRLQGRSRTAAPTPSSSFDGPIFPQRSASCSPPRQSIRIEGFALPGDTAPSLVAPTISPLVPNAPPPTPAASLLPSLLYTSRPSTPSPSQIDSAEEGLQLSGLSSGPSSSDGDKERPRQRRTSTDATIVPSAPQPHAQSSSSSFNYPPSSPFLGSSNSSGSGGTRYFGPRLPAVRRATTSSASPPPVSPSSDLSDGSLSLSFARRPNMTRQGSMGESFAHLYADDKAAKIERARRLMNMRERGGRAATRSAFGSSSSSRGVSRSPRSGGEGDFIPEDEEDCSASDGTNDSEMEVVCDAFEPSVFASARSNSATSLSSASSMRCTSPFSVSYSKDRSPLHSSPRSCSSPLSSSPPLQRSSSITTAPHRPTFPRSPNHGSRTTSPTVSRRSSLTRHRSRSSASTDQPLDEPKTFLDESEEARAERLRIQLAVKEAREMEEEQRIEALQMLGRDATGRKESTGMGGALRKLFGLV